MRGDRQRFSLRCSLLIVGLLLTASITRTDLIRCCPYASGSCKSECGKISLVSIATDENERISSLQKLNNLCGQSLVSFWKCLNETLEDIGKGEGWVGRPCCHKPQSERCKMACLQAQRTSDLSNACRKSDEISFYNCIERQETGENCCKNAQKSACKDACKKVFMGSEIPSKDAREAVLANCAHDSQELKQCIKVHIRVTPAKNSFRNMLCCNLSHKGNCKATCEEILQTETIAQDVISKLNKSECGPISLQDTLWQCFLINSAASEPGGSLVQSEKIGMDIGKLQCCQRAVTVNCQRLCNEAYSTQWTNKLDEFQTICLHEIVDPELVHCLEEVQRPCELGCKNLNFCTNFNSRPTELFRSCDPRSDRAAKHDIRSWEHGTITLNQYKMTIPVMRISECYSDVWKAIACTLNIRPCHHQHHVYRICRSDCIDILEKCVDHSRLGDHESPVTICNILSPTGDDEPCISLADYLVPSRHIGTALEVTHSCKPNPCLEHDVCMVERNCHGQKCRQHVCVPGCRMGDMSQLIVPRNTHVRVPSNTHGPRCLMVCYCNHEDLLEDCVTQLCLSEENCWYEGKKYGHNTEFKVGCKTCFCLDGEVTCTPKQCGLSLPCGCQDHYISVCGANGKTYPSTCLAKCAGLTDDQFEFGACYDSDPCSPNSCHPFHRCVPKKRICLSIRHRSCKQYDCVNLQYRCNEQPRAPVCDTDDVEHPNICWMLQRKKALAYYGKCMPHCRSTGLVCGHNGETYASECAAWSERVSVDYKGACSAVGSKYGTESRCSGVRCPPLPSEHCPKVFPPGGCCPICGAALRLLYSEKLSDLTVEAIRDVNPVVIQTIAEELREHVRVSECEVFAYLSLEVDIIVLVVAITDSPTRLQVEACSREAQKLQALIQQHSPTLLTQLPLSFFTTAMMIEPVSGGVAHLLLDLAVTVVLAVLVAQRNRMFL